MVCYTHGKCGESEGTLSDNQDGPADRRFYNDHGGMFMAPALTRKLHCWVNCGTKQFPINLQESVKRYAFPQDTVLYVSCQSHVLECDKNSLRKKGCL